MFKLMNSARIAVGIQGLSVASSAFLNADVIRVKVEEHLGGHANHRLLIWSFLSFEQWCRIFLGGERALDYGQPHAVIGPAGRAS